MKTVLFAALTAIALSGSAFALSGVNGTSLNYSAPNGLDFPVTIDPNSLHLMRAVIKH